MSPNPKLSWKPDITIATCHFYWGNIKIFALLKIRISLRKQIHQGNAAEAIFFTFTEKSCEIFKISSYHFISQSKKKSASLSLKDCLKTLKSARAPNCNICTVNTQITFWQHKIKSASMFQLLQQIYVFVELKLLEMGSTSKKLLRRQFFKTYIVITEP